MNFRRFWFAAPLLGMAVASVVSFRPETQPPAIAQTLPTASPVPAPPAQPTPTPIPQKWIKVGLSTAGAPLAFYPSGPLTLSDPFQSARTLKISSGTRFQVLFGPNETLKLGGQTYQGPITIETPNGASQGWQGVEIKAPNWPTRVTSNGTNPRWGRPYRGNFQVFLQQAPDLKRKGDLTLINVVPLEEYLKGVVPWEMNPTAPLEALKAQAICARSETLAKLAIGRHKKDGFDMCDFDHCQGYPGTENEKPRSTQAVEETRDLAVFYGGRICDAVYGTNSGGITAASGDVWKSSSPEPYLQSVRDFEPKSETAKIWKAKMTEADWGRYFAAPWSSFARPGDDEKRELASRRARFPRTAALYQSDDWPEFYRWRRFISLEAVNQAFLEQGFAGVNNLEVVERAPSGHIKKLRISGFKAMPLKPGETWNGPAAPLELILSGDGAVRSMLSKRLGSTTALPSSSFAITPQTDAGGKVSGWVLQGAGWGHGVGMCQRGAQNHALAGWDARRILKWYFRDVEIGKVN